MNKINLFIPVEIKKRDFASRALIGYLASLKNYNVFIGRKLEIDQFVFQNKPGIYFGLVTTEAYSNFYNKLKNYGHYIFVNDEEGLVTFSDEMYFNLKVSSKSLSKIDILFLWSLTHKKMFSDRYPSIDKYVISGSPRYDFSKKNLVNIFDDDLSYIRKKYKKYVLVCCSFSFANYFLKNTEYAEVLQRQKVIKNKNDLDNFNKYLSYNKEALYDFIDAIKYLSLNLINLSIIVRPHPSENMDIYKEIESKYSNVFVESRYSIHPWIINSQCIVHNYCTSSSEALALGVPRFALRKSFDKNVHKKIAYEPSHICKDKEQLLTKINDLLNGKIANNDKILVNNFKKYLHNIDIKTYASKIIVNNFDYFISKNPKPKLNYKYYLKLKLLRKAKKIYKFIFGKKNNYSKYINHKVDKVTDQEIKKLFNIYMLENNEVNFNKFKITQQSKNIININYLK